jgi:hypothetical protein
MASANNVINCEESHKNCFVKTHIVRLGDRRNAHTFCLENMSEKKNNYFEDLVLKRRAIKWISKKENGKAWTGLICVRVATSGGLL